MATKRVCVTGASGLLGSWLVKKLLESGYYVRGTVRGLENPKTTAHLWELRGANERLELLAADFLTEGVFDSVVEGCEGVFHTAAPTILTVENPEQDIVQAAVSGTLNLLEACRKSSTVRCVVLTSSSSTVRLNTDLNAETIIDENMWSSIELCRTKNLWYALGKTLSEQAAWDFAIANGINLVTVIPGFIIGPLLPAEPRSTLSMLLGLIKGDASHFEHSLKYKGYVHLDDVATAHILVYEHAGATGRYLCSPVDLKNVELAEALAERLPEYNVPTKFEPVTPSYKAYNCKRLEDMGLKFKGLGEMLDDFIQSLKLKGVL